MPVINVNPGIRNYQSLSKAFCSIINDEGSYLDEILLDINDRLEANEGVAMRSIDTNTHLKSYVYTSESIKSNLYLEEKFNKVRKEDKRFRTSDTLSKDQTELIGPH